MGKKKDRQTPHLQFIYGTLFFSYTYPQHFANLKDVEHPSSQACNQHH